MGRTDFDRRRASAGRARSGIALLALLAAGCASAAGGSGGGGWEVARQWGCDPAEVEREYAEAHPGGTAPVVLAPRAGWSACQLLALNGPPSEVDRVENESGATYHLFYRTGEETRLVTLRRDVTGEWRVSAIVW